MQDANASLNQTHRGVGLLDQRALPQHGSRLALMFAREPLILKCKSAHSDGTVCFGGFSHADRAQITALLGRSMRPAATRLSLPKFVPSP
jgi:hypothetical protein